MHGTQFIMGMLFILLLAAAGCMHQPKQSLPEQNTQTSRPGVLTVEQENLLDVARQFYFYYGRWPHSLVELKARSTGIDYSQLGNMTLILGDSDRMVIQLEFKDRILLLYGDPSVISYPNLTKADAVAPGFKIVPSPIETKN